MRRLLVVLLLSGCAAEPLFGRAGTTGDRSDVKVVAGEYAVVWRDDATPEQIAAEKQRLGLRQQEAEGWGGFLGTLKDAPAELLARLKGSPLIEATEPVYQYEMLHVPNDPDFQKQWHMQQIGAETAWDWGTGAGVVVAVIDTGVSQLSDMPEAELVPGHDFVNDTDKAADDQGHGSHVAGTIAQATNNGAGVTGLAHGARIMPVKVLSAQGSGTSEHIAEGIRWAVDHGAKVLNLSLGGGGYSVVMKKAVDYARAHGAVVVCAAGNGFGAPVSYPAAYDGALAVSAVRFDRKLAPYSSYGPEVALAAPGGDKSVDQNKDGFPDGVLQQTLTGFEWYQGTSMATPHVAAAAAILAGAGVTRAEAIQAILEKTAVPLGDAKKYGAGEIDVAAALKHVRLWGGLWRLGIAVVMAFVAGFLVRRRDLQSAKLGPLGAVGLVMTSCGLLVLPLAGHGHAEWARVLSTPLPEWGQLLGGAASSSPLWLSAVGPFFLLALARVRVLQGLVAGLILGYAAYLAHAAAVGWVDLAWIPGRTIEMAFLAANAFTAFVLGMVALRRG